MELPKLLPDLPDMTKTSMGEKGKAKHSKGYKPEDSSDCTIAKCMDCVYRNDEHCLDCLMREEFFNMYEDPAYEPKIERRMVIVENNKRIIIKEKS